jgi:D-arabinose 1-dehydrogenase-like Zn-dependent alcohol dehydrogenase
MIRVATFAGPGAAAVIREVPRPRVPKNAALIQIGACGVCGTGAATGHRSRAARPRRALGKLGG